MVRITLEGNRREVYAMGFDLLEARNEKGLPIFGDIKIDEKKSTFREEDAVDITGALAFRTEMYGEHNQEGAAALPLPREENKLA